jgi:hypothetical protein
MTKFPVATQPLADESLLGFIARACDRNGHPTVKHVLELAGHHTNKPNRLVTSDGVNVDALAKFFGCTTDELSHRFNRDVALADGRYGFINFHGVPLRKLYREPVLRRLSPASLRTSAYHRASWILRPLRYCPESGELLIDRCPNPDCAKPLGWQITNGIPYCEHCLDEEAVPKTDLRTVDLPKLAGEELETYSTIANLITKPPESHHRIPATFASWKPWEIFDFVVLLAKVLSKRFEDRRTLMTPDILRLPDWHENFMMAGRTILGWPKAFNTVVETMRASAADRRGHFGRFKEIGQLAVDLRRIYNASGKECTLIESAVDDFYASKGRSNGKMFMAMEASAHKWTSFNAIREKYSDERFLLSLVRNGDLDVLRAERAKRSPIYFNREQIERIITDRRQLVALDRLTARTGLPMSTLEGLCLSGHIVLAGEPIARFLLPCVQRAEAEKFENSIIGRASQRVTGETPLLPLLQRLGLGHHLLRVVRACLDGEMRFSRSDGRGPALKRLMVLEADVISLLAPHLEEKPNLPEKMTARDVSIHLDISHDDVRALVRTGFLKAACANSSRYVDGKSVGIFSDKFISDRAVSRRLEIPVRAVKKFLRGQGISPQSSFRNMNGGTSYIWRRSKVESLGSRS